MARSSSIEFGVTPAACFFGALALLVLPLKWILAGILAAAVHECCHYLALRLCGVRIYGFSIGSGGAIIETEPMGEMQELVCALAGPAGSLLLLFLIRRFPLLALCAGIQGFYNLLPILPFDGGRAVSSILGMIRPEKRGKIMDRLRRGTIAVLGVLGIYAFWVLKLGFGVVIVLVLLIQKALGRKIPCKAARKKVQ